MDWVEAKVFKNSKIEVYKKNCARSGNVFDFNRNVLVAEKSELMFMTSCPYIIFKGDEM